MMNKKEKRLKRINGLENLAYSIRARTLIFLGLFPKQKRGEKRIRRLTKKKFSFVFGINPNAFIIKRADQWGSTRPEYANTWCEEAVKCTNDSIVIETKLQSKLGRLPDGRRIERGFTSGSCATDPIFPAEGIYCANIKLDPDALGSWDAFWLMRIQDEPYIDGISPWEYREFDGIERFYGKPKESNSLTTSIHRGYDAVRERELYNNSYNIPKKMTDIHVTMEFNEKKKITKTRINGLLVFVGRQWYTYGPLTIIVNSGIQYESRYGAEGRLVSQRNDAYRFEVSNIKHLTNHVK